MKYYQEVTLIPQPEIPLYYLWEKVYQQVHLALVEVQDQDGSTPIGVSFPAYNVDRNHLGNKLRFFAESELDLVGLKIEQWLSRLYDYLHVTEIRTVPEPKGFACYHISDTQKIHLYYPV